jgi:hypothetical protein
MCTRLLAVREGNTPHLAPLWPRLPLPCRSDCLTALPPCPPPLPCRARSFVVAHDLTTGKDVAYRVKTTATPAHSGAASPRNGSAVASRASTPDRSGGEGPAAAEGHASPSLGAGGGVAAAEALGGVPDAGAADVSPGQQGQGQQAGQHARQQQGAQQRRQAGPGPQAASGFEHFGHHRHPSPATQRDWRLPGREANALPPPQEPQQGRAHGGRRGSGSTPASGAVSDSSTGSAAAAAAPLPAPACYRGTVAQVARAGRQQGADDGLLLYIDEDGGQQRVRYGAGRLVEGCSRLEPGDAVEFELAAAPPGAVGGGYHHHPAAPHPHRAVALNVRLLSRGMAHSPSLEAVAAAAEAGDGGRGRQLGRVTLLKKEFGFIRQVGLGVGAAGLLRKHARKGFSCSRRHLREHREPCSGGRQRTAAAGQRMPPSVGALLRHRTQPAPGGPPPPPLAVPCRSSARATCSSTSLSWRGGPRKRSRWAPSWGGRQGGRGPLTKAPPAAARLPRATLFMQPVSPAWLQPLPTLRLSPSHRASRKPPSVVLSAHSLSCLDFDRAPGTHTNIPSPLPPTRPIPTPPGGGRRRVHCAQRPRGQAERCVGAARPPRPGGV